MAQQQKPAQPAKIKVRILVESFGSPREPVARFGDVIEIDPADLQRFPGTFEDIEATERAREAANVPKQDPWFMAQKEALRAEREASAAARVIAARRDEEAMRKRVAEFEKLSHEG